LNLGPYVILTLKAAVLAVTVLFVLALLALWRGNVRLHGRINLAFFVLTLTAVLGLEVLSRMIYPWVSGDERDLFSYFDAETKRWLRIHLCFSVPAALLLPLMLFSGLRHRRNWHIALGILFTVLWTGTFVTGIFFLPHQETSSPGRVEPEAGGEVSSGRLPGEGPGWR
jgi:uncharacterized membrane protein YozB (DUF420 family)